MRLPLRGSRAFTLLELIVVIVVLGILAAIAVPTFQKVIEKSQDSSTRTTLEAIARDARALYAFGDTTWVAALETAAGETARAASVGTSASTGWTVRAASATPPAAYEIAYTTTTTGLELTTQSISKKLCTLALSSSTTGKATCGSESAGSGGSGTTPAPTQAATVAAHFDAHEPEQYGYFGESVDVDGNVAVVGAPGVDVAGQRDSGAAYVYTRNASGVWSFAVKLPREVQNGLGISMDQRYGSAVSISNGTIVVGAGGAHAAYVYTGSGSTWTQQTILRSPAGGGFGNAVDIDGTTLVVGAPVSTAVNGWETGAAYVYTGSGATWSAPVRLESVNPANYDNFASSVTVSGDTIVVGKYGNKNENGHNFGAIYIFDRNGTSWNRTKIQSSDYLTNFGFSVDLDGNTLAVGAIAENQRAGAAYVYTRPQGGGAFTQQGRFVSPEAASDSQMGRSVSIDGDTILIGASQSSIPAATAGSVLTATRTGSTWSAASILTRGPAAGAAIGTAVAIDGKTALMSSRGTTVNGIQYAGSVDLTPLP